MDIWDKFYEASKLEEDGEHFEEVDAVLHELLLELGDHYSKMKLENNNSPEFIKQWEKIRKLVEYSQGTIEGLEY